MKKLITILIAVIYLVISSGVIVNMHYCMGKLADVTYKAGNSSHCGICGMQDSDCCHDDVKLVKLDDTHKVAHPINFELVTLAAIVPPPSSYTPSGFAEIGNRHAYMHHPPDYLTPSFTILHSVFRI